MKNACDDELSLFIYPESERSSSNNAREEEVKKQIGNEVYIYLTVLPFMTHNPNVNPLCSIFFSSLL